MSARGREALLALLAEARQQIKSDRDSLFDSHVNPRTGKVEDDGGGVADYDDLLNRIDAALESKP